MTKGTELANAKATTGDQLPAYLQGTEFKGNDDNFDSSDVLIPRIKLLQSQSGEVETFDNAKAGVFWHTGLDQNLGDKLRFVVADRRKKYLLTTPLSDDQGVLARADDAVKWDRTGSWEVKFKDRKDKVVWEITDLDVEKSGLTKWGTSIPDDPDSPPAATLFYDYLVYLPDHPDLGMAVMSLARSQIRTAKKGLNDKISIHGQNGRPMQSLVFEATVTTETGIEGNFKNYVFQSAGFVQDVNLFNTLTEYKGALGNLKIKDEGMADQDEAAPVDDGTGTF